MHESASLQRIMTQDNVAIAVHRLGERTGTPVILAPGTFSNWSYASMA